ncbi:CehA/McbA family metallohydrolase [Verrucomicrobium sp. BvORR106]|uniref:CehA/McbA family metallohydrolase n=1 Tax=Verrucomicrobium sp. BvORR106 TaxID=1403819 RepID=UPI00057050E6|nr:CehA/McbA family metallohydrolase [Verrucomicrobium sp. BvORR106]
MSHPLRLLAASAAFLAAAFAPSPVHAADAVILESRTQHLGKAGSWEWEHYKDKPVDAERMELTFTSRPNATACTLHLWQKDVKLSWPVFLNNKKLGNLTTAETALETVLEIPPGTLVEGENKLRIEAPPSLDDIEIGPIALTHQPVAAAIGGANVKVAVTCKADESPLPCRLTLTRRDGTLQPLRAEPAGETTTRVGVVYAAKGQAVLSIPPGDYVLHAGRGFEWGIERREFTVKRGETVDLQMALNREVDTTGWVAADSHIHTLTHSGHGDATIEDRMRTIAGEGIELAIATDHNHHTDYGPAAASTGTASYFTGVRGNEVTTKGGHFNAFPVDAAAVPPNHQELDWAKLIPSIRATSGVKVVTLNHPRDLHSGFIPFGGMMFNPKSGKHRHASVLDIDAIEVITSAAMQSDVHLLYRDWFALLNRGHRISAIASSDSHDVNRFILGQGRTYVAADDANPANLKLDDVWRSYKEGRLLVSLGLLTQIKVNDRYSVGDLATKLGEALDVQVTVSGPSWVTADKVELYANGILIKEMTLPANRKGGVKGVVHFDVAKPAHDVHLVAIATGPGVTEPFWEIPRPYQPTSKTFTPKVVGSTNPIWIDADDDGQFHSAHAIAQALVHRAGGDGEKLKELLKGCDEAVRTQVQSLQSTEAAE